MIIIGINHINGEIDGDPFIIKDWNNLKKYWIEGYKIYKIDWFNETIEEIKYD